MTTPKLPTFWFALHSDDPGEIGGKPQHEVSYPGYQRVPVSQFTNGDWLIGTRHASANALAFEIRFPEGTEDIGDVKCWSVLSEAGDLVWAGELYPSIRVASGVTPTLVLNDLYRLFVECSRAADFVALVSMRGVIADAAHHPARDAALRAIDRLARPARR